MCLKYLLIGAYSSSTVEPCFSTCGLGQVSSTYESLLEMQNLVSASDLLNQNGIVTNSQGLPLQKMTAEEVKKNCWIVRRDKVLLCTHLEQAMSPHF